LGAKIEGVTRTPAEGEFISKTIRRSISTKSYSPVTRRKRCNCLQDITPVERQVLSGFRTSRNETVLPHRLKPAAAAARGRVHRGTIISGRGGERPR